MRRRDGVEDGPGSGAARALPAQDALRGILFMVASAAVFAVMNTLAKLAAAEFALVQVVWARTLTHLVFLLALFAPRRGLALVRPRKPREQLGRSVCLIASTLCFFGGLTLAPLAEGTAISFVAPLLVVLLAWLALGERVRPASWVAVALGLAGVLVVVRPGTAFQWSLLLFVGSAGFNALYQILTRKVAGFDPPETSVVYSALVGSVAMSAAVPFVWTTPATVLSAAHLLVLGVLGGTGHYCIARAFAVAPASIVSPFNYLQLVGASLLGYLVFADVPSLWTWAGAALIVAAGLLVLADEVRRQRRSGGG
jgi:drug/metabolite transporter (DMT)-like permease